MVWPSGDQAGARSGAGLEVSLTGAAEPICITWMSKLPSFPSHANATNLPSGDSAGLDSWPLKLVSGTGRGVAG